MYHGQQTTHFLENNGFLKDVWLFGFGDLSLQKTTWPTKAFRDPYEGSKSSNLGGKSLIGFELGFNQVLIRF